MIADHIMKLKSQNSTHIYLITSYLLGDVNGRDHCYQHKHTQRLMTWSSKGVTLTPKGVN